MTKLRYFAASLFGCLAIPLGLACLGFLLIAALVSGESVYDAADRYLGDEE